MATFAHTVAAPPVGTQELLEELERARARTLALVAPLSDDALTRALSPLMSPLVWDLGHIAAYEDLWLVHRHGDLPLLHAELAAVYDAFETPRAVRGDAEILDRAGALAYMREVRERTCAEVRRIGVDGGMLHEMVLQHEHQHNETMLQTLCLARLEEWDPPAVRVVTTTPPDALASTGLQTVTIPDGPYSMGAPAGRFSYDNERPRHVVDLPAFRIGVTAVTNGAWLEFVRGGGYRQREWWSPEGWALVREHDLTVPGGWRMDDAGVSEYRAGRWEPLLLEAPVCHVSWFEADAFARAHGMRLPSESEWEKAALWDPASGDTLAWPWGEQPPRARHANLFGAGRYATAHVLSSPAGAAPCGALGMVGDTWEWTATAFDGYDGFRAQPYREYSEVFFGERYRVLRGGSWASDARVATATFRNWDLPQRRQIFAGVRLACDA